RSKRDWSSDVCSSDLHPLPGHDPARAGPRHVPAWNPDRPGRPDQVNTAANGQGAPGTVEGDNVTEETGGPAILVLEDGRVFHGRSFGATGETFGEVVFNTGMTGCRETLTDTSHHRQIV